MSWVYRVFDSAVMWRISENEKVLAEPEWWMCMYMYHYHSYKTDKETWAVDHDVQKEIRCTNVNVLNNLKEIVLQVEHRHQMLLIFLIQILKSHEKKPQDFANSKIRPETISE